MLPLRSLPQRLLPTLPAWLVLCLGACSDPPATGPGRLERPTLELIGKKPQPRILRDLVVPDDLAPWSVEGAENAVVVQHEQTQALRIHGKGERRVRIPGPFGPRDFNQIVVTGIFPDPVGLTVRLEAEGQEPYVSQELVTGASAANVQPILFDLPRLSVGAV